MAWNQKRPIQPELPCAMLSTPAIIICKLLDCLIERERDVLRLIADGQTNAQIAILLCVQESTAKFHVQNILHKLGATNRTEAAQIYFRESYSGGK